MKTHEIILPPPKLKDNYSSLNEKVMKRKARSIRMTISTALMFVFMVSMSNAQDRPPRRPPMLPDSTQVVQMVDQMSEELSLTEAQKTQIINLQLEHFKQMKAIMKKDKAQHEKTRAAVDSLRDDMKKQMNEVLTDKQQKQFQEFMESHRPTREERPEPQP